MTDKKMISMGLLKRKTTIIFKSVICFIVVMTVAAICSKTVYATSNAETQASNTILEETTEAETIMSDGISISLDTDGDAESIAGTLQMMLVLTVIALAPSILIMLTSFTRIIVVLHFVRTAIGTQTTPPNQVLTGLALFLTLFIMSPIFTQINTEAIKPYAASEISQEEAIEAGLAPLREFMFEQANKKDLNLFIDIAQVGEVETLEDIPTTVLIPAFIISELRIAFTIGFLIYIPFIIIDMVVASTLMSMGMMMLPPTTISMPFKILLFILADGWNLILGNLVKTFY